MALAVRNRAVEPPPDTAQVDDADQGEGGGDKTYDEDYEAAEDADDAEEAPSSSRSRSSTSSRASPVPAAARLGDEASVCSQRSQRSQGGSSPSQARMPSIGQPAAGPVDEASLELASLVRPAGGVAAPAKRIWETVVDQEACLPGCWDTTAAGALDAARAGDWPLCAYLAASCYRSHGGGVQGAKALAVPDERCHRTLWLEVTAPVVVDVPRGQERLLVQLDGRSEAEWAATDELGEMVSETGQVWVLGRGRGRLVQGLKGGSAEHFRAGETLELSQLQWRQRQRLRRLQLRDEDRLELHGLLAQGKAEQPSTGKALAWQTSLKPQLAHVPGTWYHVLAYPLAGDLTKALLRPTIQSWAPSQREAARGAARWLGETLVSQCAKSGNWEMVEVLLSAGVPCPDLSHEFESVCGPSAACRRQWRRDLLSAFGAGGRPGLLEMAAFSKIGAPSPLAGVLQALKEGAKESGEGVRMPELQGGVNTRSQPPLSLVAAEAGRWDIVGLLLEHAEGLHLGTAALLASPCVARCPAELVGRLEAQAQQERASAGRGGAGSSAKARSLGEYFRRVHSGEILGAEMLPKGCQAVDGCLEGPDAEFRVLDKGLRLGLETCGGSSPSGACPGGGNGRPAEAGEQAVLAFVLVTRGELAEARASAANSSCSILPLNLTGRRACAEPLGKVGRDWLAVLCPQGYLQAEPGSDGGPETVQVPVNCMPTPHLVRTTTVRVTISTPCCGRGLEGVPLFVAGRKVGLTGADGGVEVALPPGEHTLSSPGFCLKEELVLIEPGGPGSLELALAASGELFFYLQDNSYEEDYKDGLMLTCSRENIPDDAGRFVGAVSWGGAEEPSLAAAGGRRPPRTCVPMGRPCSGSFQLLTIASSGDGREYKKNEDLTWFDDFADECEVALLFTNLPIRLGDLLGQRRSAAAAAHGEPSASPAAEVPQPSLPQDAQVVVRRRPPPTPQQAAVGRVPPSRTFSPGLRGTRARASSTGRPLRQCPPCRHPPCRRSDSPLMVGRWCDSPCAEPRLAFAPARRRSLAGRRSQ
eukprot:TRINITY_DN6385_c0_g1_i2.p1 TRINITY_DN6385_c0_g1~~TRINITY_DN6385_c0_g1_i2.p1  ORF type:complete len:1041 (-),score=214.46 TRINITY_DN6385_c0_g1_i2:50-3172(-)